VNDVAFRRCITLFQYIDYPADNHKLGWNEMLGWLREKRWQSMSFGGIVYLVLLIPVVNILMMPAAVAGATLFWVRERGAEARGIPAR
jgi:CysZ protein